MGADSRVMRELGLGPRWVRRDLAPDPAAVPVDESPSGPQAVDATGVDRVRAVDGMDWAQLRASVAECTACGLARTRRKTVFGVGGETSPWLFVGEAPGADEDASGEPFVGQAGRLLDNMLAAIGLRRGEAAFIANILKCRPPGNRDPEPAEAAACLPYLHRQIALLRPRLIVALGKVAATGLLGGAPSLASLRGRIHDCRGTPLVVTYHPAALLRTPAGTASAWEDLCLARDTMRSLGGSSPD